MRSVLFISALLVMTAALLIDNLGWPSSPGADVARVVTASVLVIALLVYVVFRSAIRPPTDTALGRPIAEATSAEEIVEAYAEVIRNYNEPTLTTFVRTLIDLPQYVDRINEDARLEEAPLLLMTTRQQFIIPKEETSDNENRRLLVPLIRPEKGTLLDTLAIVDQFGAQVPTLSHARVRGLLAYCLTALLRMAPADETQNLSDTSSLANEILGRLIMAVCAPGPLAKQPVERQNEIAAALAGVDKLPVTVEWRDRIKRFCSQYVDFYVVVAEVERPNSTHLMLSYSHRVPCESTTGERLNRWRVRLGLTPTVVDLSLHAYAFQVPSYHLQVSADSGQYVFDHHLEILDTKRAITQDELRQDDFRPYVRLHYQEGRPNAHLYVRKQGSASSARLGRLKSVVEFREIPPGVLGSATIVASAGTALITFFALTHLGLQPPTGGSQTPTLNNVPALLLALPAFTAALIGSWADVSRIRRASLTTYLALLGIMILSLTSTLYYMWDMNGDLATERMLTLPWGQVITTEVIWLVLAGLSWTLALFLVRQWLSESRYYFGAVKRRVDRRLR